MHQRGSPGIPTERSTEATVLSSSTISVKGPTPPRTGEMEEAFSRAPAKSDVADELAVQQAPTQISEGA